MQASKQAAHYHSRRPGFPAPVSETPRGRTWLRADVEAWADKRREDEAP